MDSRVRRSYLFVPANRPERFAKACAARADAVIVDLEDAVPAAEKASARKALSEWLSSGGSAMVRINGATTAYFADDLRLAAFPTVQGIVLPKTENPEEVRRVSESAGNSLPVLPLIESARGFADALAIAKTPNVQRLMFGSIDFQLDMGISGDHDELLYFRSHLVLASRLADLQPPVDGVTTSIENLELVRADGVRGKRLGFGGKLCIHPKQVAVVNECYRPSEEELAWAKRIVAGASAASGGAVSVDGAMVDRPVLARAEAILASSGERQNRS